LCVTDIAAKSIEQAEDRWRTMRGARFDATFAALDCYTESLSKAFPPAKLVQPFDVVSMQFCMHYAFETVQKARIMLENASRWLRPGGIFVGTIPNADQLLYVSVTRLLVNLIELLHRERLDALPKDAEDLSFGNSVYKIRFDEREQKPIFGHKYWFFLQDAVENVPEYIVRWQNFVECVSPGYIYL
jgi:mRNA (guanine-N7-)-methyltransferase